jgi:MtaA/CmuA family methyltransferase
MNYTSRERVNIAMNMQKPDRVPLMCQFSIGSMMQQLKPSPAKFWYDGKVFADGLIELCERFGFDGILVSLHGHSPDWGKDILEIRTPVEGREELIYSDRTEFHTWTDLPMVKYHNKQEQKFISDVDVSREVPSVIDYIPVSQDLYFKLDKDHMFDIFEYLRNKVGDKYSIHGELTSPFDYFLDFMGYENALVSLIIDPEKCKEILQKFTDGVCNLAAGMCKSDIDAVKISSPFAGMGFISPEHYEEFVLPYESQFIKIIKDAGKKVYIHTCGHIGDRLELMKESGASGLECLDPEPVGNVDLADAFSRIGNDMFIKGNIDSVNTLLYADDEKAAEDVKKIIETGKNGKGFILSTACSIAPMVSSSRISMLRRMIDEFGRYS